MRDSIRRYASAAILALAGALVGCAAERPESVPADAKSIARQNGSNPINFTAPEDGKVYVYDRSTQKMVYSGRLTRGEALEVDARRNNIRVDGQKIADTKLRDLNEYQVWYDEQPPAPAPAVTAGATAAPAAGTGAATAGTTVTVTTSPPAGQGTPGTAARTSGNVSTKAPTAPDPAGTASGSAGTTSGSAGTTSGAAAPSSGAAGTSAGPAGTTDKAGTGPKSDTGAKSE